MAKELPLKPATPKPLPAKVRANLMERVQKAAQDVQAAFQEAQKARQAAKDWDAKQATAQGALDALDALIIEEYQIKPAEDRIEADGTIVRKA